MCVVCRYQDEVFNEDDGDVDNVGVRTDEARLEEPLEAQIKAATAPAITSTIIGQQETVKVRKLYFENINQKNSTQFVMDCFIQKVNGPALMLPYVSSQVTALSWWSPI